MTAGEPEDAPGAPNWSADETPIPDASAEDMAAFTAAIAEGGTAAGETVYLSGRYSGDFVAYVSGTIEAPITFRPAPGGRAAIDGSIQIRGTDTAWHDLEFCYTGWTTRIATTPGAHPPEMPITKSLSIYGARTRIVHPHIHDMRHVGFWATAIDSEIYGAVIYNMDFRASNGGGYGHGIYTQNNSGVKRIRHFAIGHLYSAYGIHAYAESGNLLGFEIEDGAHYPPVLLVGGLTPVDNLAIRRVFMSYRLELGYGESTVNGSATLEELVSPITPRIRGDWGLNNERIAYINTRFGSSGLAEHHVLPDEIDPERAIVVIYNAPLHNWATVDLSALALVNGRRYVLRSVENYAQGYAFDYDGVPVRVPLTGWTVSVPIAADAPLSDSFLPAWGAFILQRA